MDEDADITTDPTDAPLDDRLDALLRRELADELTPHVGSATAKLDALLRGGGTSGPSRLRIGLRWSAAATLLVGLGVGGSIVAHSLRTSKQVSPPIAIQKPGVVRDAVVTSWTETYDAGTVLVGPTTPARMLERVRYEQTDWTDDAGQWQRKVTVPERDVILLELNKQ